jgi:hypothetical protein
VQDPINEVKNKCEVEYTPCLSLLCPWRLDGLDSRGWIPGRGKMFLFSTTSRPVLGPTQAYPVSTGGSFSGVKTFAKYDYFHIMPSLIYRIPTFLIESRATPGISASININQEYSNYVMASVLHFFCPRSRSFPKYWTNRTLFSNTIYRVIDDIIYSYRRISIDP